MTHRRRKGKHRIVEMSTEDADCLIPHGWAPAGERQVSHRLLEQGVIAQVAPKARQIRVTLGEEHLEVGPAAPCVVQRLQPDRPDITRSVIIRWQGAPRASEFPTLLIVGITCRDSPDERDRRP
jgi:hypothetical protein